jgi:hypothetical protein
MAVIKAANFAAANAPNYTFNNRLSASPDGDFWTQTVRSGAGPDGRDAVEVSEVNGGDATAMSWQHSLGWDWNSIARPSAGSTRYLRMWMKILSPFYGSAQPDPVDGFGGSRWGNKLIILGQPTAGEPAANRAICTFLGKGDPATCDLWFERGIEGGDTRIMYEDPPLDTWLAIQWKIVGSSSTDASDARTYLYVQADNNSESTPTLTSPAPFVWNLHDIGQDLGLGRFADAADDDTEIHVQFARFEYADTFDTAWYTDMGAAPPPSSGGSGHPVWLAVL